jgi:hypothetical protein
MRCDLRIRLRSFDLQPDHVQNRMSTTVFIYRTAGFVVKLYDSELLYKRELLAYQVLAQRGVKSVPKLLAQGTTEAILGPRGRPKTTADTLPFIVMTYHGEPIRRDLTDAERYV